MRSSRAGSGGSKRFCDSNRFVLLSTNRRARDGRVAPRNQGAMTPLSTRPMWWVIGAAGRANKSSRPIKTRSSPEDNSLTRSGKCMGNGSSNVHVDVSCRTTLISPEDLPGAIGLHPVLGSSPISRPVPIAERSQMINRCSSIPLSPPIVTPEKVKERRIDGGRQLRGLNCLVRRGTEPGEVDCVAPQDGKQP